MDPVYKCIIVDDDSVSRMIIEGYAAQTGMLRLVASCESAIDAAKLLSSVDVDILFLDVEMPGLTGIELLKSLKRAPKVVLITGKKEYAAEAFDFDVEDYIVKPAEYPRFLKAVLKVAGALEKQSRGKDDLNENIFVKVEQKFVSVSLKDILYVEAQKDYVKIVYVGGKLLTLSTLKSVEAKLPSKDFIRVHRSYIVRLDKITDIQPENLLIGKEIIPISETYKNEVFSKINIL